MSSHDLKTSLRHTHAYINAYDLALLQAIERAFRQDRAAADRSAGSSSGEDDGAGVQADPVNEQASVTPAPEVSPWEYVPERRSGLAASRSAEPDGIATWHLYMPALLAAVVILTLLVRL